MPDKSTAEPESDAFGIPVHTASTEELEACLELKNKRYLEFLRNNPSLQDPRIREEIKQKFKERGLEYLRFPSPYLPGTISVQVTDGSASRMIDFESEIARLSMALREKQQGATKHRSPSVGQGIRLPDANSAAGSCSREILARKDQSEGSVAHRNFPLRGVLGSSVDYGQAIIGTP